MAAFTKEEKSWALYDWANSAYSITVTTAFFPIFFNQISSNAGLSASQSTSAWAWANTGYALLMAVLSPILGTISDYYGFKKKFFAFFFLIGVSATAAFVTIGEHQWLYALILYIISAMGISGSMIFNDALLPDITEPAKMSKLSSFAWAIGYIGGIIPFMICFAVIKFNLIDQSLVMPFSFLLTALWWLVFSLPFMFNVKQRYGIKPEPHFIRKSFKRLTETLKEVRQYRPIFLFLLAYFFYIDGVGTIFKIASDFALKAGIASTDLLMVLLMVQAIAVPFTLLFGYLSHHFSLHKLIKFNIIIYLIVVLMGIVVSFLPASDPRIKIIFIAMALLIATSQGSIQALSRSFFAGIIPKDRAGEFFGLYDIFAKFAAIMGPGFIALGSYFFKSYTPGLIALFLLFGAGFYLLNKAVREAHA